MHTQIQWSDDPGRSPGPVPALPSGQALFRQAQAGCRDSLNELMRAHDGLVHAVVRRQVLGDLPYEEALQAGRIGLWRAIVGYDPDRGWAFSTYAWPSIARHVWRAAKAHREQTLAKPRSGSSVAETALRSARTVAPACVWEAVAVQQALYDLVNRLPSRLRYIIAARYGLGGYRVAFYREIGARLHLSGERVRGPTQWACIPRLSSGCVIQPIRNACARCWAATRWPTMSGPTPWPNTGCASEEAGMGVGNCSPAETRAQDPAFVHQCSFHGLRSQLPLRWPTPADVPPSPKKRYRSHYVYLGCVDLDDALTWEHLSPFDLVLRLVDLSGLRPVLALLLGWTSARGWIPFDPISMFLFLGWQLTNGWTRAEALRHLADPRYADYAHCFGFENGVFPTEGGVRYFLTTIGHHSAAHDDTVMVQVGDEQWIEIGIQYLNHILAGAVTLLREAHLISPQAWVKALLCPDGMIHDAASRMRCAFVQDSCYQSTSAQQPRPCPAQEKGNRGCDCDTLPCVEACRYAPIRDREARSVYYARSNQPSPNQPQASTDPSTLLPKQGELRYGYRSLALQFAEPYRRFSVVLLDDFLPANRREENPSAALLLQLGRFYPHLGVDVVAGDAGLGYYAFLHTAYHLGAKRAVDLRADPSDKDQAQWTNRRYDDKGRPVCPFGYAFTANGFDADKRRHKWFCRRACLKGVTPVVRLPDVSYPPEECPYRDHDPYGQIVNVAETFKDGSIRLARDLPVGTLAWKRVYHRARNASEDRNSDLEGWGLKRLPVYGQPRGRALTALADAWTTLTTLARLVREATFASHAQADR